MVNHASFQFFITHIEIIIEWLFVAILAMSLYLSVRWLFGKREEEGHTDQISTLESTLKKVLAQNEAVLQRPAVASSDENSSLDLSDDMKDTIAEKERLIAELKKELKNAKSAGSDSGASAAQLSELNKRIAELEGKLQEYEIIEEDIADLSAYKEENVRLKDEITKLKAAGPAPVSTPASAPAPVSTAPAPAPATPPQASAPVSPSPTTASSDTSSGKTYISDDIMAEFAAAVNGKTAEPPDKGTPVQSPPPAAAQVSQQPSVDQAAAIDNVLDEFAAAVAEQKAAEAAAKAAPVPPPPIAQPVEKSSTSSSQPVAEPQPVDDPQSAIDNILGEFAASIGEQKVNDVQMPSVDDIAAISSELNATPQVDSVSSESAQAQSISSPDSEVAPTEQTPTSPITASTEQTSTSPITASTEQASTSTTVEPTPSTSAGGQSDVDDLLAQFASAVEEQKAVTSAGSNAVPAPEVAEVQEVVETSSNKISESVADVEVSESSPQESELNKTAGNDSAEIVSSSLPEAASLSSEESVVEAEVVSEPVKEEASLETSAKQETVDTLIAPELDIEEEIIPPPQPVSPKSHINNSSLSGERKKTATVNAKVKKPTISIEDEVVEGVTNDIMAEFTLSSESAEAGDQIENMAKTMVGASPSDETESDDASSEDEKNSDENSADEDSSILEAELNMDKMLQEVAGLEEADESVNSLEEQMDTDKLLSEAAKLGNS